MRDQREAIGAQLLLERCAELLHRLLGDFVERGALGPHGIRVEDLSQFLFHEFDQTIDAAAERAPAPARQGNESRAAGLGKVVDVSEVVSQRAAGADLFKQLAKQALSPSAGDAAHINVLARREDLEPVTQRFDRVVLADDAGDGLHLVGGLEPGQKRLAAPAQHVSAEP